MLAAYRLLARAPYAEVTLERVAREAGISKGLVSYYFGSKEALFVATIRAYHDLQARGLRMAATGGGPARDRLRQLVLLAFPSREHVEEEVRFQSEVLAFAKTSAPARSAVAGSYRAF